MCLLGAGCASSNAEPSPSRDVLLKQIGLLEKAVILAARTDHTNLFSISEVRFEQQRRHVQSLKQKLSVSETRVEHITKQLELLTSEAGPTLQVLQKENEALKDAANQERQLVASLRLQLKERDDIVAQLHERIRELELSPAPTSEDDMQVDEDTPPALPALHPVKNRLSGSATTKKRGRVPRHMALRPTFSQPIALPNVTFAHPNVAPLVVAPPGTAISERLGLGALLSADRSDFPVLISSPRPGVLGRTRTFPAGMEMHYDDFPLWYRRFPLISVFSPGEKLGDLALQSAYRPRVPEGAKLQSPVSVFDLFSPRYSRGSGQERMIMCPICAEPKERGGEDVEVWLTNTSCGSSTYSNHMRYTHGLCTTTRLPFSPPVAFSMATTTGSHPRQYLTGKCHECSDYIELQSTTGKGPGMKTPEKYWWRHAADCHRSCIAGECDYYYEDELLSRVLHAGQDLIDKFPTCQRNPNLSLPSIYLL